MEIETRDMNEKPTDVPDELDTLEEVLSHVGEMGLYQKLLFLGMMPFGLSFAFVYFVQMFVAATPQHHWCYVPDLAHLDLEVRRNLSIPRTSNPEKPWENCVMYDLDWSQVLLNQMTPSEDTPTVPCKHGWEFQYSDIPYPTVVSERGWVCNRDSYATIAQSIFFSGSLVGGLFFGWFADRYGRVPALVGANVIGFVGGIASIFTTGLWDFSFCRFVAGMAYDSCFMMMYILVLEYVGSRYRTMVANMSIALYFGSGCLILPWMAYFIANWRMLLIVTSTPMLLVLAAPWLIPESARWLTAQGKVNRAVSVLRRFEKVNKTKVPPEVMEQFVVSCRQKSHTDESFKAMMSSPALRLMMVVLIIVYMACAVVFDGLVRMSDSLGLDFFITFTLTSATEIPSVTLLALVLDWMGRKKLTVGPMWLAGVLSLFACVVPKGIPQVALAVFSRFCINMSYNAIIQWATELLPTGVRATGSSVVHVSGYIATVISPFIVYTEQYWHEMPLLILGIASIVAGSMGLFLPETKDQVMPQTIADGEKLFIQNTWLGTRLKKIKSVNTQQEKEAEVKSEKEQALIT